MSIFLVGIPPFLDAFEILLLVYEIRSLLCFFGGSGIVCFYINQTLSISGEGGGLVSSPQVYDRR